MSKLLNSFHDMLNDTTNKIRRTLLTDEIKRIANFSLSGDVIERQFFVIIWERVSDENTLQLKRRANELADKFQSCGVPTEILKQSGIYHLIKLFAHPQTGYLDLTDDNYDATIPFLEVRNETI